MIIVVAPVYTTKGKLWYRKFFTAPAAWVEREGGWAYVEGVCVCVCVCVCRSARLSRVAYRHAQSSARILSVTAIWCLFRRLNVSVPHAACGTPDTGLWSALQVIWTMSTWCIRCVTISILGFPPLLSLSLPPSFPFPPSSLIFFPFLSPLYLLSPAPVRGSGGRCKIVPPVGLADIGRQMHFRELLALNEHFWELQRTRAVSAWSFDVLIRSVPNLARFRSFHSQYKITIIYLNQFLK